MGEFDAAELASLELAGTDATIPTLEATLSALSGPIVADLKLESGLDAVASHLTEYEGQVLASSFRPAVLAGLPPSLDRAVLASPPAADANWSFPEDMPISMTAANDVAADIDAAAIHPQTELCGAERVARAQKAGFAVNAWTICDQETAAAMAEAGVDGGIADSPAYVAETRTDF